MEPPSKKVKQSTLLNFSSNESSSNSCLIEQCDADLTPVTQDHEAEEWQEPDYEVEGDHVEVPAVSNLTSENEPPCSSTTSFQPQVL